MQGTWQLIFRSFRFDPASERLWHGAHEVTLRPKTFAVLRYLLEHAGQLVTKADLLDAIWPDISVSDVVPTVCVQELRKVLGDPAGTPRFIETVPKRGYRFIAPLTTTQAENGKPKAGNGLSLAHMRTPEVPLTNGLAPANLIGREAELEQLSGIFDKIIEQKRQIIFISGELGIGKTALVEAFLTRLSVAQASRSQSDAVWIGRGQCIEHHGEGEDFLPILDALRQLCRTPGKELLLTLLHRYAPTWLLQLPVTIGSAELEVARRRTQGLPRERMLWEIAEVLERIACEHPLVLWIEDLHWSDASTLELLAFLARRREPTRLLLIGTYRPVEVAGREHLLTTMKQELQLHHYGEEMQLLSLREDHVVAYLRQCFPEEISSEVSCQRVAHALHQYTNGNPLLLSSIADHVRESQHAKYVFFSAALSHDLLQVTPEYLVRMVEQEMARLTVEEQRLLEAASVVGVEFTALAVAAALEVDIVRVEEVCGELARREQFVRFHGTSEWPDGSVSARFRFQHAFYREAVYLRVTGARRVRLHRRIGERTESAYGHRTDEIASALAAHFECGRDFPRAVKYLRQAAETAWRCGDPQEAERLLTKGIGLVQVWPDGEDRTTQERELQVAMANVIRNGLASVHVNENGVSYLR
jgi:DNA-binding winged helix-turn-helix (wHTH) protein